MNRRKKGKRKTARRASVTPADPLSGPGNALSPQAQLKQIIDPENPDQREKRIKDYEDALKRLEAQLEDSAHPAHDANLWCELAKEFRSLKEEELKSNRHLRAHGEYKQQPPGCGHWGLSGGMSENFRARFRKFATRAGRVLGSPQGTRLLDFWLHHVLLRNISGNLILSSGGAGMIGEIPSVCEASDTFCWRLEEEAQEACAVAGSSSAEDRTETLASAPSAPSNTAGELKMRIGQNVAKLMKECGWSFDRLAGETGIDKKGVLSHVHGKSKPNPRTLKRYAQEFSTELQRPVTANDLEK